MLAAIQRLRMIDDIIVDYYIRMKREKIDFDEGIL